jgi:hypothetical protein
MNDRNAEFLADQIRFGDPNSIYDSRAQMMKDMQDPRWGRDALYTKLVESKQERTAKVYDLGTNRGDGKTHFAVANLNKDGSVSTEVRDLGNRNTRGGDDSGTPTPTMTTEVLPGGGVRATVRAGASIPKDEEPPRLGSTMQFLEVEGKQ